ncbi:alcohol oxidase [Thozetella sp. PMI_491]|nr:alcohol oxidase [Thozetella sp. PMI_491]
MGSSAVSFEDLARQSYSFIIVGGGTAGLVLAARLTEIPQVSVLVLEAGENRLNDPKVDTPALMSQLYEDPDYDWCLKTVPQTALENRTIAQPRGKLLGGSSAINFMMATHPSKADIDNWSRLGNPEWTWEKLMPYYRKSENLRLPPSGDIELAEVERLQRMGAEAFDPALYGQVGPVKLTMPHATTIIDEAWRPTLINLGLGLPAGEDPRKGDTLGGYSVLRFMDESHKRSYATSAYYEPFKDRTNLTVLTGAHVQHLIVILSAGTFASPKLLELSGIGSASLLQKLGLPLVVDNPSVGENLQDHTLVSVNYEAREGLLTAETIKQPGVLDWALGEWAAGKGGPLATGVSDLLSDGPNPNALQAQVLKEVIASPTEADLQFNFAPTGFDPYQGENLHKLFSHSDPGNYIGAVVTVTHPVSRGSSHIVSSGSNAPPAIDPKYLASPVDFDMTVDGLLFLQKVFETKPMADLVKDREDGDGKKLQPSFEIDKRMDRIAAEQLARSATISSWHPIGTCSMLPRSQGGVVDDRLRVYGVQGLRVVDASIMPLQIRGNIASSVYAIAEKAADMIKEDWGLSVQ